MNKKTVKIALLVALAVVLAIFPAFENCFSDFEYYGENFSFFRQFNVKVGKIRRYTANHVGQKQRACAPETSVNCEIIFRETLNLVFKIRYAGKRYEFVKYNFVYIGVRYCL